MLPIALYTQFLTWAWRMQPPWPQMSYVATVHHMTLQSHGMPLMWLSVPSRHQMKYQCTKAVCCYAQWARPQREVSGHCGPPP